MVMTAPLCVNGLFRNGQAVFFVTNFEVILKKRQKKLKRFDLGPIKILKAAKKVSIVKIIKQ